MFLLKILNKPFLITNLTLLNLKKSLSRIINILIFIQDDALPFFMRWIFVITITNFYHLKGKINYFLWYCYLSVFENQKLIRYILSINLSITNTIINFNNIKGQPRFFYSAGMFQLQKKQKIRQPKAVVIILQTLLLKAKIFKTKPAAIHFNDLYIIYQSYLLKKLKQKIFVKLVVSHSYQSHNGCRLKKKKRLKIRTNTV